MILLPLTEHSPFDLVAYKDGEFRRVQVKYRAVDKFGKVDVQFSTSWSDKHGTHTSALDKSEVDIYCIYCPDADECYYLRPADFGSTASLRVKAAKNGQQQGVNLATDYRGVP